MSEFEANSFVCTLWRAKILSGKILGAFRSFDPANSETLTSLIV